MILSPFVDEIRLQTVNTSRNLTRINGRFVKKLRTYMEIPSIDIDNTWRGASEIVLKFVYEFGVKPSFLNRFPLAPSPDTNFVAVVSWKPTSETIVRYKLWEDVGEILYVDMYAGQPFASYDGKFNIEIWNTDSDRVVGGGERIYTSQLVIPTNHCDYTDRVTGETYVTCLDLLFPLEDFVPADLDYFAIDGCDVTLIKRPDPIFVDGWLIKATDATWHTLELITLGDSVFTTLTPAATPPEGTREYMPIVDQVRGWTFKVNAVAIPNSGPNGETTYHPYISGTVIDFTAHPVIYFLADDGNYYGVSFSAGWIYGFFGVDLATSYLQVDQEATIP